MANKAAPRSSGQPYLREFPVHAIKTCLAPFLKRLAPGRAAGGNFLQLRGAFGDEADEDEGGGAGVSDLVGDAAGLIHPLCGNGMAMAIQGGRLQANLLIRHSGTSNTNRQQLEREYRRAWQKEFRTRLWVGARLQEVLTSPAGLDLGMRAASVFPPLPRTIIRKTHGTL